MKPRIDPFRAILVLGFGFALTTVFVRCADAGEADLSWTAPTKRCDGTPLTDLAGYSLTYGQARTELPLTPLSFKVTGLAPGTWWFSLAAVDAKGERSEAITVSKTITPAEFVTIGGAAFTVVKRQDGFLLLPVGTVAAGVQCIAAHSVNGRYAIPRAAVTWSGSVRPDVVVAECR